MPKALVSVSDKTGLAAFAARLAARGWDFLASGGSARALREAGFSVTEVADYSGSPEILGGRVKTLHPAIHGGILSRGTAADRAELASRGWSEIDLVVVNLYPFEATAARAGETEADCVEEIDIGGVALMRAAAKNFARVCLAADPADYDAIASEIEALGAASLNLRRRLAAKGFAICTRYDAAISNWLAPGSGYFLFGHPGQELRYGENPHQQARLFTFSPGAAPGAGPLGGRVLQGKELSYNNILDLDAAWRAVHAFEGPAAVVVKHLSPCGIAEAASLPEALAAAIACDPVSAYGGVIAVNRPFEAKGAAALGELFVECIAAPGFSPEARKALAGRKNCRLLELGDSAPAACREIRSIENGFLVQDIDSGDPESAEWKVISKREPTEAEWASLSFAWKAITSVKSNAIVLAAPIARDDGAPSPQGFATIGIGSGQPNRVDAARIAAERAKEKARGAVLASDAFFPFPDSVEVAASAGVTAIIQPGGSIRDKLSLEAADAAGMAMVVTGVRHFRH